MWCPLAEALADAESPAWCPGRMPRQRQPLRPSSFSSSASSSAPSSAPSLQPLLSLRPPCPRFPLTTDVGDGDQLWLVSRLSRPAVSRPTLPLPPPLLPLRRGTPGAGAATLWPPRKGAMRRLVTVGAKVSTLTDMEVRSACAAAEYVVLLAKQTSPLTSACWPTVAATAANTPVVVVGTARTTVAVATVAGRRAATGVSVAVPVGVNGRHPDRHTPPLPRVRGGVARTAARNGPVTQREGRREVEEGGECARGGGDCRGWGRPATSVQATAHAASRLPDGGGHPRHAPAWCRAWGAGLCKCVGHDAEPRAASLRREGVRWWQEERAGWGGGNRLPTRLISRGSADRSGSPRPPALLHPGARRCGRHSVAMRRSRNTPPNCAHASALE